MTELEQTAQLEATLRYYADKQARAHRILDIIWLFSFIFVVAAIAPFFLLAGEIEQLYIGLGLAIAIVLAAMGPTYDLRQRMRGDLATLAPAADALRSDIYLFRAGSGPYRRGANKYEILARRRSEITNSMGHVIPAPPKPLVTPPVEVSLDLADYVRQRLGPIVESFLPDLISRYRRSMRWLRWSSLASGGVAAGYGSVFWVTLRGVDFDHVSSFYYYFFNCWPVMLPLLAVTPLALSRYNALRDRVAICIHARDRLSEELLHLDWQGEGVDDSFESLVERCEEIIAIAQRFWGKPWMLSYLKPRRFADSWVLDSPLLAPALIVGGMALVNALGAVLAIASFDLN